jgi:hypothetical protein
MLHFHVICFADGMNYFVLLFFLYRLNLTHYNVLCYLDRSDTFGA